MELQFLGTGSGVPAKFRNVSSIALKLLQERNAVWLFDVGEGTQMQILHTSIRPRKIEKIFITHLHGDHIFGLPGLLSSRSFQGGEEKLTPIDIYGPIGIKDFIKTTLSLSSTKMAYPVHFYELSEEGGKIFEDERFIVHAMPLEHGVLSFGYRVEEKDQGGRLNADRLVELGVPFGPIFGRLKQGEVVELPDGRIVNGKEFIGEPRPGRVVTVIGDTRKTKQACLLAVRADVLVHEATFEDSEEKKAHYYFHSTSTQAAKIAKEAGVGQLILNHYSARYNNKDITKLCNQAREIFENTIVVKDFDEVEIPYRK
ncbi:MAG: ribonuclease Z [Lactobacillales bacterium]|nr:ribonuclease Z [Lactobacillales bacterium]